MTDKEKYIAFCAAHPVPLHAQPWWMDAVSKGKGWDVILVGDGQERTEAAMPFHHVHKYGLRAILMPVHTQYHYACVAPGAPEDIYARLAEALDHRCRTQRIGWVRLQGFYPEPLLQAFRKHGFSVSERTTYRIAVIPERHKLPELFSQNKRRQLRKAQGMSLTDLQAEDFYAFHKECLLRQGKHIDYPEEWARAVLPEAVARGEARIIGAQDAEGRTQAAMFLAWDEQWAYYLLPTYHPAYKDSGAMAWLTNEALCIAQEKGLGFDFEGSMTPSIASSYRQFGGNPETYYTIEKYYSPLIRAIIKLRQQL